MPSTGAANAKEGNEEPILSAVYQYFLKKSGEGTPDNPYKAIADVMQQQFPAMNSDKENKTSLEMLFDESNNEEEEESQPEQDMTRATKRKTPSTPQSPSNKKPKSATSIADNNPKTTAANNKRKLTEEEELAALSWDERIEQVKEYAAKHGHCRIPSSMPGVGVWAEKLRSNYIETNKEDSTLQPADGPPACRLNKERIAELSALNFDWSLKPVPLPWRVRYQHLVEYHKRTGHTRVPRRWKEDPHLSFWIHTQRKYYREKKLSAERMELLEKLNFEWLVRTKEATWEERIEECKQFRQEHGHLKIPVPAKDEEPENKSVEGFQRWAEQLRAEKRKHDLGFESKLTKEQIEELDELDFDWGAKAVLPAKGARVPWDFRFRELEEYKKLHGDCRVPKVYKENEALGTWVSTQRRLYSRNKLQPDRLKRLKEIGFCWNTGWKDKCSLDNVEAV